MIETRPAHHPLLELMSLTCVRTEASPEDFLALTIETASRTFMAGEAFMVVGTDDPEPLIVTTPGAICSEAVHQAARALAWIGETIEVAPLLSAWRLALSAYGRLELCPIELEGATTGILGLVNPSHPLTEEDRGLAGHALGIIIDNFRAYHDARFHLARQSLLRDIGRIFSAPGALGGKLSAFVTRMHLFPSVDGCSVSLLGEAGGSRRAICHLNSLTVTLDPALERSVLSDEAPVYRDTLTEGPVQSYLGLPLIRRETVVGILSIVSRQAAAFSRKDVEFFAAVSEHIALNLDNAWLLEETQKQVDELTFVSHMSSVLRHEQTLPGVLQRVLEKCVKSVAADVGYLFVLDTSHSHLALEGTCGGAAARPVPTMLDLAQELRYSENPRTDFGVTFDQPGLRRLTEGMERLLLIPLCTDRGLLAVLLVGHRTPGVPTESEHRLISTLINAAENAIGRATALEEMRARVREEAASRAKSELLAVMSHELRTPLTAILGFTELLADNEFGPTNETQQQYLQEVLTSARHLLALINDILDVAKVEAGKVELVYEPVDVHELLDAMVRSFGPLVHRKGITLRVRADATRVPAVQADARRLKQILYNLVSNAVKFTDSGWVELGVRGDEDCVHFEVQDTGIGIPSGEHDQIFKPFHQGTRPRGRVYEGTGLGLSLSRRLAELHGGALDVMSELGVGSTFHLILPRGGKS